MSSFHFFQNDSDTGMFHFVLFLCLSTDGWFLSNVVVEVTTNLLILQILDTIIVDTTDIVIVIIVV